MATRNASLLALAGVLVAISAGATTYQDNFTGGKAAMQWIALGDACLTAGTQNGTSSKTNPIVPGCQYKTDTTGGALPTDSANQGALLLTPAVNSQTGAILSDFTFPMSQGLQVTFTTYSYGSTSWSGGAGQNLGADGIVFFLTDGTQPVPSDTGATGGAMGYDCSVTNYGGIKKYEGIANGYLGLGMDEWGNFLNNGDNGSDGVLNTNAPGAPTGFGGNPWSNGFGTPGDGSGKNYQPNRIGMRGAGNINRAGLNALNPGYYPATGDQHTKVMAVCKSGRYKAQNGTMKSIPTYNPIPGAFKALPESQPLAHRSATSLAAATPITYKVTISPSGVLAFSYSYNNGDFQSVLDQTDISSINGTPPSAFRFGFSAGTGGDNNVHEITCFTASPLQSNSSAGTNAVTGKAVQGATQFFLPGYSQDGWWGSLAADPLVIDSTTGALSIGTVANWDAKCALTGGPCDSMGVDATGKPIHNVTGQTPASRNLYTWNNGGVALQWGSALGVTAQAALGVPTSNLLDTTPGKNRVAWLRGDRSVEKLAAGCSSTPSASPPCDMRARTYVLGDIINSSPTFVASPIPGVLPDVFMDKINASDPNPENLATAQKYSAFASANATRRHVVYVGGNDGFVHGFEAGAYKSDGSYDPTYNDGNELFAYMPNDVLLGKVVNLTNPTGTHDYLVDATPSYSDLYYGGAWHTWLVGGVGTSGQEIYALEVTDPTSFTASDVIGDWDNNSTGLSHLGYTVGTPIIARMHNGQWALIFGSGLHNDNNGNPSANAATTAGVYIGLIDSTTGNIASFQFLDTGTGTLAKPDGIAYVSQVDLDGDHVADYLYAGDTQGNVWRFDVTSGTPSTWGRSASRSLVFTAKDASGNPQPITTAISTLMLQTGMVTRNMLYFGTGHQTQQTATQGALYVTRQQTFYGIWDWNMSAWNAMSSTKLASLTSGSLPTRATLLVQALQPNPNPSDLTHRYLDTTQAVCWKGDAASTQCPSPSQYGWMFDLPGQGPTSGTYANQNEQIIYNAAFIGGAIVVNTAIPPTISAAQCKAGSQSGWIMAFNPATGGGFPQGFFPDQGGGFSGGGGTVGGIQPNNGQGGVGTPTTIQYGGNTYLATQTLPPGGYITPVKNYSGANPSRVSWRELVNP